jgi:hypothetical protein
MCKPLSLVINVYEAQSAAGGKSGFLQQPIFEMTS